MTKRGRSGYLSKEDFSYLIRPTALAAHGFKTVLIKNQPIRLITNFKVLNSLQSNNNCSVLLLFCDTKLFSIKNAHNP